MNKWINQIKAALNQSRHVAKKHTMTDQQRRSRAILISLRDTPAHERDELPVKCALSLHNEVFAS